MTQVETYQGKEIVACSWGYTVTGTMRHFRSIESARNYVDRLVDAAKPTGERKAFKRTSPN